MSNADFNPNLLNEVTQEHLEAVHGGMQTTVQMWVDGLITDKEFTAHFAKLSADFELLASDNFLTGLLDPATGLRY